MANKGMTVFTQNGEDFIINDQNIANEFSTEATYAIGNHVTYQGNLYVFTKAHTAGAWNAEHVTQVTIDGELKDLYDKSEQIGITSGQIGKVTNNLFNIQKMIDGEYLEANSTMTVKDSDFARSDFIPVVPGVYYSGNFTNHLVWYNSNKEWISGTNIIKRAIAPSNARYARFDFNKSLIAAEQIMFIQGRETEEYLTEYYVPHFDSYPKNWIGSIYEETANLFDASTVKDNYYVDVKSGAYVQNSEFASSDFIEVEEGETYTGNFTNHLVWFDENHMYISGTNTITTVTAPANAKYAKIDFKKSVITKEKVMYIKGSQLPGYYIPHYKPIYEGDMIGYAWDGKTWSAYGDSITAISNGDGLQQGWAAYVNNILMFGGFHGRGIGGQSFKWKEHGGSVSFVNSNGNYVSRNDSYNKDNYSGAVPEGTTAIRGAFCSWDRITHMYPAAIKDTIDLVYIMGGTNDTLDTTALEWMENDATDPEWAASPYYSTYGGDYNINTLEGGIASTIMKMQAWMPQAIIVIGTPLNGQTNVTEGRTPGAIPDEYQKSVIIASVAKMFGCPCIDVYGTCGINVLNSPTYITDGTHPYNDDGKKMLARAVISGLQNVYPNIE